MSKHVIEIQASGSAWTQCQPEIQTYLGHKDNWGYLWWSRWYITRVVIWRSRFQIAAAPLCRHVISLGKEFTHIAQVKSACFLNWTDNDYQLRLGSKSLSILLGLASYTWGSQVRHKHYVNQFCLQDVNLVKRYWSICKCRYTIKLADFRLWYFRNIPTWDRYQPGAHRQLGLYWNIPTRDTYQSGIHTNRGYIPTGDTQTTGAI